MSPLNRRDLLKGAAGAGLMAAVGAFPASLSAAPRRSYLIRAENEKEGTTDWMLSNTRVDPKTKYRCPWIEGYCSHTSLKAGETLKVMVSTNPASAFVIDLYRLGYYGGKGGRHLGQLGPFEGTVQPDPEVGEERLRDCQWEPATEIAIPQDWPSGVYLGKLTAEKEKLQSYIIFIVRDDRPCDFLFQCSDTTWSAYNRWPDEYSLYNDGVTKGWYVGPNVRVSWDRPYGKYPQVVDAPLSQGSGEYLLWEFPFAFWMEKNGYDLSYISNVDTHADPKNLLRCKAFLSIAHDEYWTREMFDNAKAAIDEGGIHAGFFSGNAVDGMIGFFPSSDGVPNRILTRLGKFGGVPEQYLESKPEVQWFKESGPDPATLMGARTTRPANGSGDWTCVKEDHWIFEGTGMKNGDSIPDLVGWEHHGNPADIPGLEVLARGPITSGRRSQGVEYTATVYPGPKDNLVFNAATIWWGDGLSAPPGYRTPSAHGGTPQGPDPRVQRMTKNLFDRFLS